MAQGDILKRYLDAGLAFTQMTRERAEAIVQDLVKNGEIRRKEAEKNIEELVERSRKNTEDLLGIIRREVAEQLKNLGLEDLAKRAGLGGSGEASATSVGATASETPNAADDVRPAPTAAATTIKAAAKKAAAKKAAPAKTSGAKKAAAKKAAKKSSS